MRVTQMSSGRRSGFASGSRSSVLACVLAAGLLVAGAAPVAADNVTPTPSASSVSTDTTDIDAVPNESAPAPTVQGSTDSTSSEVSESADSSLNPATTDAAPVTTNASPVKVDAVNGIPALSITLPDGVTLSQVNSDKDVKHKDSAAYLTDPTGTYADTTYTGVEIKGRGNYTWKLDKKPYQIKLSKAASLLGMESSKTWILLANHADASLLRNTVAFGVGNYVGLSAAPQESRYVDLYVNGAYVGNYQLTEKIEISKTRLNLKNESGIVVELDNSYGMAEPHYFKSATSGTVFAIKEQVNDLTVDGGNASGDAGWVDIQADINALDKLLYASSPDWSKISELVDVDSFAKYFILTEFTANPEVGSSSVFFYKDGVDDKLHMGPAWDFDSALGAFSTKELGADATANYTNNVKWLRKSGNDWYYQFFRNPEFARLVNSYYSSIGHAGITSTIASISTTSSAISKSAAANFTTWPVLGKASLLFNHDRVWASTYSGEVSYLKSWVSSRVSYLDGVYGGSSRPVLSYDVHAQSKGWMPTVTGGLMQGTTGQSKRVEAMKVRLLPGADGKTVAGSVLSEAHVASIGWQGYKSQGAVIGTTGQSKAIEAIRLKLSGGVSSTYDIQYRVYQQTYGWSSWVKNGATAGVTGQSKRVEAVEMQLVSKKGFIADSTPTPDPSTSPTPTPTTTSPTPTPTPTTTSPTPTPTPTPTTTSPTPTPTPTTTSPTPTPTPTTTSPTSTPTSPAGSVGTVFYLNDGISGDAGSVFSWGVASDEVLVGDWNGDGKDTVALRRGNTYAFTDEVRPGSAPVFSVVFGNASDEVLVGDWNGDGKDTLGVRRGSAFYLSNSLSSGSTDVSFGYGRSTDAVFVGDWNGDGKDTISIRRDATFHVKNSLSGGTANKTFIFGRATDEVLVGSFGSGKGDSFALRRGTSVYLTTSLHGGTADKTVAYGRSGDEMFMGDWNGDGTDGIGVRR
ncbi:CotH kinase family protein [Changpingibacter yushuensis]|uniref:CotH kinase family protein n=1 Tax=Changpingibacter yushuensis TaxID=2758440 RepID=UPI0015F6E60E|nr:CotH kinase family protein [Changpingibacter yushuensis]